MKELDLPVLKTFLPDTKRFRREQNASRRSCLLYTSFDYKSNGELKSIILSTELYSETIYQET